MKSFRILSIAVVSLFCVTAANAQAKTETFKVSGNCGMCKNKIEKAALEAGAKSASWDADTKVLTVSYKQSGTNTAKIQSKIAEVGYDNEGAKASDESYNKLHGCCKYDRVMTSVSTKKASCCKEGETCKHDGNHEGMDCCKGGKCTKEGHEGKDCCKDGKCTKEGHNGKDCCKKAEQ